MAELRVVSRPLRMLGIPVTGKSMMWMLVGSIVIGAAAFLFKIPGLAVLPACLVMLLPILGIAMLGYRKKARVVTLADDGITIEFPSRTQRFPWSAVKGMTVMNVYGHPFQLTIVASDQNFSFIVDNFAKDAIDQLITETNTRTSSAA